MLSPLGTRVKYGEITQTKPVQPVISSTFTLSHGGSTVEATEPALKHLAGDVPFVTGWLTKPPSQSHHFLHTTYTTYHTLISLVSCFIFWQRHPLWPHTKTLSKLGNPAHSITWHHAISITILSSPIILAITWKSWKICHILWWVFHGFSQVFPGMDGPW